jgi:integrase
MSLTDTAIRKARPGEREWKLADEKGLYLLVTPRGSKLWRVKYRFNGTERKLALGQYPDVALKDARAKRDAARKCLQEGVDPGQAKKNARVAAIVGAANTFKAVAEEYIAKAKQEGRAEVTIAKARWLLAQLTPALGARPVTEVSPHELLVVLKKVEKAGKRETARRLRSFASRVFRYAVATARASQDPAQALQGELIAPAPKHHAALTDSKGLGELLRAMDLYSGEPATVQALKLAPHVFQRPGEVRQAEWTEMDFDNAVWVIPPNRMKQRVAHHVPLSRQALAILRNIQSLTGGGKYVFPSARSASRPMSENTINGALRRLGYGGDVMTAHGFRSTASSLLNQSGRWNPDAIERALSHKEANQVRAVYHRAAYWDERVKMAQWWSNYLDMLRKGVTRGVQIPFPNL